MQLNPLLAIDFYKVDHRRQYPEGTTEIYSNFTPRYVLKSPSLLDDFDNKVVVFGLQYFIRNFLCDAWDNEFFSRSRDRAIREYKSIIENALGIENFDCSHLESLHDLGYLPIKIKALPEGTRVPIGVPVLTIVNTHPDFFWLTNYLETIISASLWKPITCATIAFEFKRLLTKYAKFTGSDETFIPFQAHDFSFRGMSGLEDAAICGAAHLTSFQGTDCVPAIALLNDYYSGQNSVQCVGSSVPATEHSVMTCNGIEGEFDTIKRLITEVYSSGIVSIVADSYNFWKTMTVYLPKLHKEINEREGKVVIRPDSGNPVDIVCGDINAVSGSPAHKGALQLLWDEFGGTVNKAGFRELNPKVGLIYGDAITVDRASLILQIMREKRFASSNIVFGFGSFSYQYNTRDTFGFAMKATSCVVNGERRAIFKDPTTSDDSKKKRSAKGLLSVHYDPFENKYELNDECTEKDEEFSELETVFENGEIIQTTDLSEIRFRLQLELDNISE